MNKFIAWWISTFNVISAEKAIQMELIPIRNVYGDEINLINCRSIWKNKKGNTYRVRELQKFK